MSAPELSVILPTDTHETILPVLKRLRGQTMARRIEVILVTPAARAVAEEVKGETAFASIRVIGIETLTPLGGARAAGIQAALAPLVFVGETHSFLRPGAAEALVAAMQDGWTVAVPGFENGNPTGALSWAGFLVDYSRWDARLPAGEIPEAPLYDCVWRRDALLALGGALGAMLSFGDDLRHSMQARGYRVLFHPAARIDHVNIEDLSASLNEHHLIGLMIGARRASVWPWWRRLAYIAASPLIPLVLLQRGWPGMRRATRGQRVPLGAYPAALLLFAAKAAGEVAGYAGGDGAEGERTANHYEIRRFDYAAEFH